MNITYKYIMGNVRISIILLLISLLISGCNATSDVSVKKESAVLEEANDSTNNDMALEVQEDNSEAVLPEDTSLETVPLEIEYATQFSIDKYENGYEHIHIADGSDYIIVPEGMEDNDCGYGNVIYIRRPCNNIYLASTSVMDIFDRLSSLDAIATCSTKAEDYSIENASNMIRDGSITYIGKYSAPDYEMLLASGCDLAIENTMILHSPKVKEEIEDLGIPVLLEYSSYEEDPLGRLEWIKLYGAILDKEEEAIAFYNDQIEALDKSLKTIEANLQEGTDSPEVAFFYLSTNGYVNVRKPGDYFSKMIKLAGGEYALNEIMVEEDNKLSTINIGWEDFYAYAKDADILIYNSNIVGEITSSEDLIADNQLFADFEAVANKKLWVTGKNVFQESSGVAEIIIELNKLINDDMDYDYKYFYKVD